MVRALRPVLLVALFFAAASVYGATVVPDGTVLPVRLNTTLSSKKTKPGQLVTARIMQDVPLPGFGRIRAGAILFGKVTSVQPASSSDGGSISLRFDTLRIPHEHIRLVIDLRAIASFMEVQHAQLPIMGGSDRSLPEGAWTTAQIGGDVVYRGGGHVESRIGRVGEPVDGGVLGRLDSNPGRGCRGDGTGDRPQALWLFSTDACGTYGLPHLTIAHAGRTDPVGEISLQSEKGDVNVQNGAGMLLRVVEPSEAGA
jgi:hypothetical protein